MLARCIAPSLTAQQRLLMGGVAPDVHDFALELGKTYLVIGMQFSVNSHLLGTGTWLHLVNEHEQLSWAPISLFEIVDGRVSEHWRVDIGPSGQTRVWPELLYRPYFHEDLGEGVPEAVAEFYELLSLLRQEHS